MLQQVFDKIAASAETVKELQQGEIILPKTEDDGNADDDGEQDEHADDEQDQNDGKQNLFDIFIRAVANICHQATFQLDGQLYQIFNFVKQTRIEKKFLDLTNSSIHKTNKRYSSFGPGQNEIETGDTMLMHAIRHMPFGYFVMYNLIVLCGSEEEADRYLTLENQTNDTAASLMDKQYDDFVKLLENKDKNAYSLAVKWVENEENWKISIADWFRTD